MELSSLYTMLYMYPISAIFCTHFVAIVSCMAVPPILTPNPTTSSHPLLSKLTTLLIASLALILVVILHPTCLIMLNILLLSTSYACTVHLILTDDDLSSNDNTPVDISLTEHDNNPKHLPSKCLIATLHDNPNNLPDIPSAYTLVATEKLILFDALKFYNVINFITSPI